MSIKRRIEHLVHALSGDDLNCVSCQRYRKLNALSLCRDCARQLEPLDYLLPCDECYLDGLLSRYFLNDLAHRLVLAHKEAKNRHLSKIFAKMIVESIESADIFIDCITWIPTSTSKVRRRGCDHAKDIAQALANQLQIPLLPLLENSRQHDVQKALNRVDRFRNMADAFTCKPIASVGRHIAIIDDVMTTGATMASAASAIKQTYPRAKLYGLTVFFTPPI